MPNPFKYTTGSESDALVKGNFRIGTGSVGKGPSETTGYYQGPNVPSGGYVIYMNRDGAPGNLSYHSAANDAELISFTNSLAGQSYTTVQQCFDYYYGQTDKVLVNQDYPADYPYIVMDGLVLYLDAGISQSYGGSGTSWTDINGLGPKNNGTLINGPTFNSGNGGSIVFDGVDDYGQLSSHIFQGLEDCTFSCILKNTKSTYNFYGGPIYTEWTTGAGTDNTISIFIGEGTTITSSSPFRASFWFQVSNTIYQNYSNTRIPVNQTVAITCIREGAQAKIYIDGILDSNTTTTSGPLDTKSNTPLIANVGYGAKFQGDIYNIQIYNRALTAQEVLQNYNAQKGRFGL